MSHSVLGWNESKGVILSWDGTNPGKLFCFIIERLQGNLSILGQKDSRLVILSWDVTTLGESFCPGIERLQGSYSVL